LHKSFQTTVQQNANKIQITLHVTGSLQKFHHGKITLAVEFENK